MEEVRNRHTSCRKISA